MILSWKLKCHLGIKFKPLSSKILCEIHWPLSFFWVLSKVGPVFCVAVGPRLRVHWNSASVDPGIGVMSHQLLQTRKQSLIWTHATTDYYDWFYRLWNKLIMVVPKRCDLGQLDDALQGQFTGKIYWPTYKIVCDIRYLKTDIEWLQWKEYFSI